MYIPNELLREPDFTKWLASNEGRLWLTMASRMIRGKYNEDLQNMLFEKFYKNGLLVTSLDMETLNKYLNYNTTDTSNVRKLVNKLTKKKIIKKHTIIFKNKKACVFEIGYFSKGDGKEMTYAFEMFNKMIAKKELKKYNL